MRSILNCLILSELILACSACGRDDPSSQSQELEVIATNSILGDMVRQVGGVSTSACERLSVRMAMHTLTSPRRRIASPCTMRGLYSRTGLGFGT